MRTIRDAQRMGNIQDNWLVRLYYDTETSTEWLGVADTHYKGSTLNQYHGVVVNIGSIRESIDLAKCTSKVTNVSVTLANVKIDGTLLSDKLTATSGSEVFLNRKVVIYSMLNGQDEVSHQVIYTGRLRGISWSDSEVELDIEPNQPWDFISIPNVQASSGRYFPVAYGDFTNNTSTPAANAFCNSYALWPCQVDKFGADVTWALLHEEVTSSRLHYHEEATDRLVPLVDESNNYSGTNTDYEGLGEVAGFAHSALRRGYKIKPSEIREDMTNDFTDGVNLFDDQDADESTTYGYTTCSTNDFGGSDTNRISLSVPRLSTKLSGGQFQVFIRFQLDYPDTNWTQTTFSIQVNNVSVTYAQNTSVQTDTVTIPGDRLNDYISVRAVLGEANELYSPAEVTLRIYDVQILVDAELDASSGDITAIEQALDRVDMLYTGSDGLSKSWSSGACDTVQEIHRDMLIRYTGMTAATPDGYADLDTARSGWDARLWLHEPEEIRDVLEQLQYEGQFVFAWAVDGDPRYIFVKSSYTSGDVSATIQAGRDTSEIKYSLTPFSDIISKQEIKYQRHPADDSRYLSSYTKTNTDRGNFNFATEENTAQIELDYLCAAVSSHATITDLVFGAPKKLIACDLLRPELWVLEVGDIIQLENDSAYYMITDATRQQARFSIKAREVG